MAATLKQLRAYFDPPKVQMSELKELPSEDREELKKLLGELMERDPELAASLPSAD